MSCTARTARRRRREAVISKTYKPKYLPTSKDKSTGMKGKGKK